ncbi:MAG: helix-turn-helix domain-containing protein, partial [Parafannyhessea umbonata]
VDGWVTVPLSQTALAQFIGGNRSAVSREMGRMVDEGVLERDGNRMRLAGPLERRPRRRLL